MSMFNCMKCYPKLCKCPISNKQKLKGLQSYYVTFKNVLTSEEKRLTLSEINELKKIINN